MFGPEIITKTYRVAVVPTPEQISAFCQISGCCRLVYNWGLEQQRASVNSTPRVEVSISDQNKSLTFLKKIKTFLKDAPAQSLQGALVDLHEAISRYKSGQNEAPTFRRKSDPEGFRFPQPEQFSIRKIPKEVRSAGGVRSRGAARHKTRYLHAPKFGMTSKDNGPIEIVLHQPIEGKIKTCTIKRSGASFVACFTTEIKRKTRRHSKAHPAVDRMIETDSTLGEQTRKPKRGKSGPQRQQWQAHLNERRAKKKRSRATQKALIASRASALPKFTPAELKSLRMMGIDRNVTNPIVTSDGDIFGNVTLSDKLKRKQTKLQRIIARKEEALRKVHGRAPGASLKGLTSPKGLIRARRRLTAFHAMVARKRKDLIHKITSWMVQQADIFVIEDLQVENMTSSAKGTIEEPGSNVAQKSGLNKAILDKGWGEFARQLEYKCRWASRRGGTQKILLRVSPAYTSQRCFNCKSVDKASRKADAYHCTSCGHIDHADINAAKNIRELGLEDLARACGLGLEDLPVDLLSRMPHKTNVVGGSPMVLPPEDMLTRAPMNEEEILLGSFPA
jgi:IS605 OrfB family transposase